MARKIQNIHELKQGQEIVMVSHDTVKFYKFLCIHPDIQTRVLLIDMKSKEIEYFPQYRIEMSNEFFTDCDTNDIARKRIEWHKSEIEKYEEILHEH